MMQWNWDRIAAAMGIVFAALFIAAFIVLGDSPKLGDSPEEIASFYVDDRGRVVTAGILFGLATIAALWFVAALATTLRNEGEVRLGATVIASGATMVGVSLMILGVNAAQVFGVAATDPDAASTLNSLAWACQVIVSWPVAALALATAVGAWRTAIFPPWLAYASIAGAVVLALGGTTWATDGFWAPDGAFSFITVIVFLLWAIVTSWVFMQRVTAAEPRPATAAV
jgi:hypothetical protein